MPIIVTPPDDIPVEPIGGNSSAAKRRPKLAETFLPTADPALVVWFNNFQLKFAAYALTVGFVAADVTALQNDYATFAYAVNLAAVFKEEAKERNQYKDTLRDGPIGIAAPVTPTVPTIAPPATVSAPGIVPRLRAIIQRIKTHPNYTAAMGQDMGIVGSTSGPAAGDKPSVSAEAQPASQVILKWSKGVYDGVSIESQRGTETTWAQIGMDTSSPYLDSRAPTAAGVPELRRYRCRYFLSDEPKGDYSDIVSVTTVP